jgi:hypothetical protein
MGFDYGDRVNALNEDVPESLVEMVKWWVKDSERAKCTLEQAIGAYIGTYPGRTIPLLLDLIKEFVDEDSEG